MNIRITILVLLTVVSSLTLAAAQSFERILAPSVADEPIPGAFGSLWVTEISGKYLGPFDLVLFHPECPCCITCRRGNVSPTSTFGSAAFGTSNAPHGAVIKTWPDRARDTIVSVRVRDLSRSLETWGTEIPVARESEATDTPITLLNLSTSDRFRITIRMYDFGHTENVFIVSVLPLQGDGPPVAEVTLPSSLLRDQRGQSQGIYFAVLGALPLLPVDAPERVRVIIRTEIPTKFWAFAAVTNNETQHVTAIAPTRRSSAP